MNYYGNSHAVQFGHGGEPDEPEGGWECEECGHRFWTASASSQEFGDHIVGGVTCPRCGAFVASDEED